MAREPLPAARYEQLSGVRKKNDLKSIWDKKYSKNTYIYGRAPEKFLIENVDLIPANGKVLDMGMGEGRHAVYLAKKGFQVTGIDISSVAVKKSMQLAKEEGVKINAIVASLNRYKIPEESFDAILCFYYVDRSLNEKILKWLKPGGVIIYEANTILERAKPEKKFDNISYFLKPGELKSFFKNTKTLKYEESETGPDYKASIVVKKI